MFSFRILEACKLGIKSLLLHKMRSALTLLGVIFGVAAVIAMLAIGAGASWEAQQQIKELGSSNIIIRSVKPPESPTESASRSELFIEYGLTYTDAERIYHTVPSVDVVVPMRDLLEGVRYLNREAEARVTGTVPWYPQTANVRIRSGRFLSALDMRRYNNVCVLGATVAKDLFTYHEPLGKRVRIGELYFQVVGILESKSSLSRGKPKVKTADIGRMVYLPITTLLTKFGEEQIKRRPGSIEAERVQLHQITVKVRETHEVIDTARIIRAILEPTHKQPDYELVVPLQLLRQAQRTQRVFTIVLGSIAGISLLVGGIGIMNIMLATITERTREIGIRRALGAKRRDIITQFLVETVVLSLSGGILGVTLGIGMPKLVSSFTDMRTIVTPLSLVLSVIIAAGVGIISGMYPATKAANIDPIEALRHE